ncbi:MAG: acyl-CoA/acyl-ACP dehydrogenase [Deltaproteobacteria bacterium]|nr:acyl-CoA/acyl-ACP dehydrogenase [Deltaproteobacteria bacterium]MBW2388088.1 acyl-CoA/acyl-ACP dehydrogenase [Deltaproteobacteria bacterium]MBW2723799.1 acyl-CoA/acyl-ACP dehydrogenase [Deltaproteobacteria bacterium]
MDFSCSDEQLAITELAKQIMSDKATPERLTELEKADGPRFDRELWRELAKAGVLGIAVPEVYGGAEMGFLELALITEQVGVSTAPIPFIETAIMAALPIEKFGSEAQKQDYLPRVVQGDVILTAALVEEGADPRVPETRALPCENGWKLSGVKICVPAGDIADRVLVPARTSAGEVGIFIVDPTAAGCSVIPLETTSDQPEAQLEFHELFVAEDEQLGGFEQGDEILAFITDHTNAALCSLALGVCEEALRLTAEYTKGREQFGQAIATFQAVGQRAADAFIDTEAIRLTSWQAAWRLSEGLPAGSQIATAKVWAAEAGHRVVHTATHLHGGMGVDKDYPLFRYFTYSKQLGLTLGGPTSHLINLGQMLAAGTA